MKKQRTQEEKQKIGWKISQAISKKWQNGDYENRKRKDKKGEYEI